MIVISIDFERFIKDKNMFNSKKLTYEECGVLGGRCLLKSGYDYNCYDMGEDFYLEAYNNFTTQTREFWIGRHYMREKILVTSFDLDDHDYRGIFDDNGRIIIDNQIANIMCRLSLKEEYFFIDNDYKLSMKGIKRRDI